MAYVEIRRSGKLIARRSVDENKARTGLRIRIGSAGEVRVTVGKPATLSEFQIQVLEGEPGQAAPRTGTAGSESSAKASSDAKEDARPAESMGGLQFSAAGTGGQGQAAEILPEIEGYRILGPIGRGGMGTVWRAEQLSTHREVALKLMASPALDRDKARARFAREVELTARLDHPHIGRIYDSGLCQGQCYYAMELIEGMPLDRYVRGMALSTRAILALMRTICQAVHYAHLHGIIHRDLKPSNILVSRDGQSHVLDFGLARSFLEEEEAVTISLEGEVAGTPAYMSPEQALGHQDQIDTRTDVFSLGVILYHLLTGRPPHDLSGSVYEVLQRVIEGRIIRPREASRSIDRELEALLLRALATDLESRYASAGELADDLDNYLSGEPLRARVPTTFYFLSKKVRKHKRQVAVAAAVAALVFGTVLAAYTQIVAGRAVRHQMQRTIEQISEKYEMANLTARILGRDKEEAQTALNQLLDRYNKAQEQVSDLNGKLGQRPTPVPARATGLRPGKALGETVLVRTPFLPGQVMSWTLETMGHRAGVAKLAYSPDGRWLASAGQEGTVRLWDSQSGHLSGLIADPNGSVADVKWSNDSRSLMLLDSAGATHWWGWDAPLRMARPISASSPAPVLAAEALAWTPRSGGQDVDEALSRWGLRLSGDRQALCRAALCLSLSPDRRTLAWADGDGAIVLLNLESNLLTPVCAPSGCGPLNAVAFSPQGDWFATCSGAGTLCLWDAHTWQPLRKFPATTISAGSSPGSCVFCWAPDGQALARAGEQAGALDIVEAQSGRVLRHLMGKDQRITSVAWSADASMLLAGTASGTLLVWDLGSASPAAYRELIIGGSRVRTALLKTDPLRAVVANSEGKVELWDVRNGQKLSTLAGSAGAANCLALARDEKTMASTAGDQTLRLWDLQTGGLLRTLKNDPNRPQRSPWIFSAAAWSPDGRKLAAGASDGWITIWEIQARATAKSFAAHCGSVTSLAWSGDGQLLVAGGSDGTARAWDVKNGFQAYAVLLPLWGALGTGVAINPEGDYRGPPQIEDELVYLVQTDQGHKMLTPTEFRGQHGWVNEPWQVGLYRPGAEAMKRIYVKADARGPYKGESWATAFRDLRDALRAAQPDTEIWVAAGIYRPDGGTGARMASFRLKNGVRLFGGFAGSETRVHERDPNRNETILSGDLKGDDKPDFACNDENSYHVLTAAGLEPNAVLDGFTITGGNANSAQQEEHRCGAGMHITGASPTLVSCIFKHNTALDYGGGIAMYNSHSKLTKCLFVGNSAGGGGGASMEWNCSAVLTDCRFVGNKAVGRTIGGRPVAYPHGGGIAGAPTMINCSLIDNTAGGDGGGMFYAGSVSPRLTHCTFGGNRAFIGGGLCGIYGSAAVLVDCRFIRNMAHLGGGMANADGSSSTLINCRFCGNSADAGGGLSNYGAGTPTLLGCLFSGNLAATKGAGVMSSGGARDEERNRFSYSIPLLVNCTLSGNRADINGGGMLNDKESKARLVNCILWGNRGSGGVDERAQIDSTGSDQTMTMDYCCIQGWSGKLGGTGNLAQDPRFTDPNGPDGMIGTPDDDCRLRADSPCRDTGNSAALPADTLDLDHDGDTKEPIPVDLQGQPRLQNGRVDIGTYESEPLVSGGRQ